MAWIVGRISEALAGSVERIVSLSTGPSSRVKVALSVFSHSAIECYLPEGVALVRLQT